MLQFKKGDHVVTNKLYVEMMQEDLKIGFVAATPQKNKTSVAILWHGRKSVDYYDQSFILFFDETRNR